MKFFTTFFSFFLFAFFSVAEVATEKEVEHLTLIRGVYKDLKMEDLPDRSLFKFEDQSFRKYTSIVYDNDRKVMRFKPKREGSFTLRFVDIKDPDKIIKQIKVTIQKRNLDKVAAEIKSLLQEIEGIEIKISNNKVLVDGYILLAKDMNRIAAVLDLYPDQAVSLVRMSPLARKKIAERIEAEIDDPQIYVEVINDFFVLQGQESYRGQKKESDEIAQAHVSDILLDYAVDSQRPGGKIQKVKKNSGPIINNIRDFVPPKEQPKKLIQVVVHYVELQKSYQKGFSFSWTPTISSDTNLSFSTSLNGSSNTASSITAIINNLLPKLNWAKEHGHARVLDSMSILTEEGAQGSVANQRQIPFNQVNEQGGITRQLIPVSISTNVTPTIAGSRADSIKLDIGINIGEVLETTAAGPTTSSNNIKTIVTVRSGQSAALGGLLKSNSSTSYNRVPSGVQNPLFRLAAGKDLNRSQSQFVVFVTPFVKATASQGVDKIKKKFRLNR